MSVTMSRTDGVTVFTVTSDPDSRWPPLCQILKSLCYSPVCCSVSQQLRKVQRTSQSVLGATQMMIGLLNIGLGLCLALVHSWYLVNDTGFPFWLGALFIIFGIVGILSEKYPSPCLVIINVILNLAGVAFAITAIVLYSCYIGGIYLWWWDCGDRHYWSYTTPSPSPDEEIMKENCLRGKSMTLMLLRAISGLLIVLSVVELCVAISCAVLGIKALRRTNKKKSESCEDPEQYNPLLEDNSAKSAA